MKIQTKEKLLTEYRRLDFPRETTAIKYLYQYRHVNVNIFFDAFDEENPNLSMVLVYKKSYYYTSLNINITSIQKEYLSKIPKEILNQVLDENNMLDTFFESIEKHISNHKAMFINYINDKVFVNTLKYSKSRKDLPFLFGIRKVPMSNNMFKILEQTMSIDKIILKKIQEHGITLVRTSDPTQRKKLTIILNKALK